MKNKEMVIAYQKELNKNPRYHESNRQRVARLFYTLHRANPLYDNNGNIKDVVSIRAYYLKHDRKEYRHILRGIRLNMANGMSNVNGKEFRYLDEFKPDQYSNMALTQNLTWSLK